MAATSEKAVAPRKLVRVRLCILLGATALAGIAAPICALAAPQPLSHSAASASNPEVKQLLADAQKAMESGNVRLALIHLKNAVRIAPDDGVVRARLGIAFLRAGDLPGAERELRQARKIGAPADLVLPPLLHVMFARNESQAILAQFPDPGDGAHQPAAADILAARALALQRLKQAPEAMDAMDRSLKLRRDAQGLLNRARLSLHSGDTQAANRFTDEAVQRFPDSPDALMFKAELLLASGDKKAAAALADRLAEKFPNNPSSQLGRIEIFLSLKQEDNARPLVEKLLAANPDLPIALYYKALLMARKGDTKGAWIVIQGLPEGALDDFPNTAAIIAQIAENAGKAEVAASILNRILVRNPDLTAIRLPLAVLRLGRGSPQAALRVLEPIKTSTDPAVVALLSRVRHEMDGAQAPLSAPSPADAQKEPSRPQTFEALSAAAARSPTNPAMVLPYVGALVEKGRLAEALAATDKLAADPRQRAVALAYRGRILLLKKDAAGAQAAFDKAIQIEPSTQMALRGRLNLLLAAQRDAEAERDIRALFALDPKDLTALLGSAEIAARRGQDQNAREMLNKAAALWPQSELPRLALIRHLMSRQDLGASLKLADDLVRTHPQNPEALALQGQIHAMRGEHKEAVASFRRLAAASPNAGEPQAQLARALFATGDRAGAARAMDAAAKLDPDNIKVRTDQVSLQLTLGRRDEALASAKSFHQRKPGLESDFLLADAFAQTGDTSQAWALLAKRFSEKPNSVVLQRLMRVAMQPSERQRTRDFASSWLGRYPQDTAVRLEYAGLLMQANENAKAAKEYEIVLKQEPQNFAAMNNLAWLIQDSDPKRAVSMLTLAAKLSHDAPEIIDTLGWIKLRQKDIPGGLKLLQKAHALQPQNGEISYHLAVALDRNADRASARKLLKALLTSGIRFQSQPAAEKLSAAWQN